MTATPAIHHPGRGSGVNVYIDGFNLYFGSIKGTPYHWLDLSKLAQELLPGQTVNAVHYFTARVKWDPRDPDSPTRQNVWLEAVKTMPGVKVKEGHFLRERKRRVKAQPLWATDPRVPNPANSTVEIWHNEEKGSDVNLATQLLLDAFDNNFERAWVVSNDSDLAWPIRMVRKVFKRKVGVFMPDRPAGYPALQARTPSNELIKNATWFKRITEDTLKASLLPDVVHDANGNAIHKPTGW
jgi:NYN domain